MFSTKYTKFPNLFYNYMDDSHCLKIIIKILERTQRFNNKSCYIPNKEFFTDIKIGKKQFLSSRKKLIDDNIILCNNNVYSWGQMIPDEGLNDTVTMGSNDTNTEGQMIPDVGSNDTNFEKHSIYNKKKEILLKKEHDDEFFFDAITNYYISNFKAQSKDKISLAKNEFIKIIQDEDTETKAKHIALALSNYLQTKDVQKNLGIDSQLGYISHLYTFLTKYENFMDVNDLIQSGEIDKKLTPKKIASGAAEKSYNQKVRDSFNSEQKSSFERIMTLTSNIQSTLKEDENLDINNTDSYDDSWVKKLFSDEEYQIFAFQMGWVDKIIDAPIDTYSQNMVERLYKLGDY